MIDQVDIEVAGGLGGRGAVSFRREKFVPFGGPDGGRGGRGGYVAVVARRGLSTLGAFRQHRLYQAEAGQPGGRANRTGRNGQDLLLEVPLGTVVKEAREGAEASTEIADLSEDGATAVLARGGRGGWGNRSFATAQHRTPRVAQQGERGERRRLRLELRLLADVGIVGLPNAGKSTLLQAMTAARPRVGVYPFTTLEPNLGVVMLDWQEFVVADLPGLVEGAAEGAGLGHEFLRHTTRARLLIHLLDGAEPDPLANLDLINRELAAYSADLAARPQIVVVNKIDLEAVTSRQAELAQAFARRRIEPMWVSAAAAVGTADLARRCGTLVQELRAAEPPAPAALPVLRPPVDRRRFTVERAGDVFRVQGGGAERFVGMMDLDNAEARQEVHRWLERRGVAAALRRAGIAPGMRVRVGEWEWSWEG